MTPSQAAKILGCDVGSTEGEVRGAFVLAIRNAHPDTAGNALAAVLRVPRPDKVVYDVETIKQARDVLLQRPAAACGYCRGTGWQSLGMRRQRCVKGCEEA